MRLVLLKSQKFANQAGYFLQNGRWHKTSQDKPAPKGAPVSAHPHAAGKPVQKETLADHEWAQLKLPAENVNAKTFNKQLDQLKAAASAGDITGIVGSGYGTNTYGKKLAIIANHLLGLLGSDHKVTPGQKAGTHAAVQTAPEIEAEAPAPKPEKSAPVEQKPAPEQEKPAPAPEKKADAELAVPDFAEGKQTKGVKAHYEKIAKKIIRAAKAGDFAALQFMVKPESGNTWKGKTDNSKKLLAFHFDALKYAHSQKAAGKDVQHPDAEKQAAQEAKELAKEQITPEKKPEPKPKADAEPKFTDKGTLANPSGYGKTFSNLKQANAAAEKLKAQGHDVYVTAQHPYQVKLNKQGAAKEASIKDAIAAAGSLSAAQHAAEQYVSKHSGAAKGKAYDEAISALKEQGYSAGLLQDWKKQDHADGKLGDYDLKEKDPLLNSLKEAKSATKVVQLINSMLIANGSGDSALDTAIKYLKDSGHSDLVSKYEAMKSSAKAEDGPKEGETKQGADGTLVFQNGRWHKQAEAQKSEQKAAATEQPKGDAGSKLSQIPWDGMLLPDSNKNAKSHNKQVAKIKAMAEAGDIEGLKNFKAGVNTYGKKQNLLAQTALAALEESAPAPTEAKKDPEVAQMAALGSIPKPPKIDNFNQAQVAKIWAKMAQDGKVTELMNSISTLSKNAAKTPHAFADKDGASLLNYAKELATWAGNNTPVPGDKPAEKSPRAEKSDEKPALADMPQKPAGDSANYDMIEQAMLDADTDQLASIIEQTNGAHDSAHPFASANKYAKAAYKYVMGSDYVSPAKAEAPAADGKPQKPTGLKSVHWNSLVNEIENLMDAGNEDQLQYEVSQTAGLESAEAKAVHEYAVGALGFVQSQKKTADGLPKKPENTGKWQNTVDALEGWAKSGDLTEAENMYYDLYGLVDEMPDAMPVLHYAQDVVAHIKKNNPEQDSAASTENDGPKEGETKQGADGMLVFHNGRWHKQGDEKAAEKPAPKGPADVEIPEFTGLSPNHLNSMKKAAEALKAKITEEGKAGFKSVLTNHKDGKVTVTIDGIKISKASVNSSNSAFSSFAKFVDELKAASGATKKAKPAPKPAPAPAAEPEQQKPIESMDSWTQTGGQGGSNPGGKFKDENGVEWYCKFPENEHVAKAEVLAAKLYGALGLNAQDAKLITKDGKVGIASRWQDVKKATPKELAKTPGVLEGFAADAWLANWDVVGMAYDNLQVDDKGHAMRVDAGGSLMYRAQGGKKAFGDHVTELDSLRDPKLNPQAAAVFGQMSDADITASVAKVAQISDAQIRIMVNNFGPGDKAERKALAETLIARKNDLIAKYPKAVKVKKKRLDPENLPVKEERLPKEHDFANWNGPGAGLSSKAPVNAANQKVESEMLAIAKAGNLNKLKDYKFQPVDIATGEPKGEPIPVSQHPSKHVQQFHQDLIQALDEIANPPQPLKIFQESDLSTLDELDMAFPSKKFGTTVNSVHSNEKMGFWVVLGGVHNAAEKFMPKKITHFTTQAIDAAYQKFKEGSKLAKHFILSVQASGSYNDLFREGKEFDHQGNKLSDVAKAAMEYATEQPEGTAVYRWQQMTKDMVDKIMSAPDGTVFQATGSMCTSMSPTATSHFGPHRVKIVYAKGAKAVDSFGSGKFAGEKEVTTLPNSRFVIMKKEMVDDTKNPGKKRLELEVLMLPPDMGL